MNTIQNKCERQYIDRFKFIDCIPIEYENSYMLIRYNPDREQYFYCIGGRWAGADNGYISKATGKKKTG